MSILEDKKFGFQFRIIEGKDIEITTWFNTVGKISVFKTNGDGYVVRQIAENAVTLLARL